MSIKMQLLEHARPLAPAQPQAKPTPGTPARGQPGIQSRSRGPRAIAGDLPAIAASGHPGRGLLGLPSFWALGSGPQEKPLWASSGRLRKHRGCLSLACARSRLQCRVGATEDLPQRP